MAEEIKFEKAMEKISAIVGQLESGEVTLDEAIKRYEEGVRLVRICQEQIARAEQKIEVLTRSLEGVLETRPLEIKKEGGGGTPVKSKKKTIRAAGHHQDSEDPGL